MSSSSETMALGAAPPQADFLPLPDKGPRTAYAQLSSGMARQALVGFGLVTAVLLAIALSPFRNNAFEKVTTTEHGDVRLYLDFVDRVREGMGFYEASLVELTAHNYPTASPFNWRTPLPMWLVAQFPDSNMGRWLIAPLAALLVVFSMVVMAEDQEGGTFIAVPAAILVLTTVGQTFSPDVFILPVNWGAVFIGLSMCCFAWNFHRSGIVLGVLAAFLRELAIGYSLTMAVYALSQKRWRELRGWCVGLVVFAVWYSWHIWMISETLGETAPNPSKSWLTFGGLTFLLATAQMNVYLMNWPQWVTALYLALGWLGLLGWQTPFGRRVLVAVGAYQLVFLVAGQHFNQYWGVLIAPLLALGVARGLVSLKELVQACRTPASGEKPVAAQLG